MMKATAENNYGYNKKLRDFANKLRKEMTKAEACLWKYALASRQMKGFQFRRQRPVLNYIADFMCKELKLVIELDGITHEMEEVILKDHLKTKILESEGFIVLRFTDEAVLNEIGEVLQIIESQIDLIVNSTSLISQPTDRRKRLN
ncbi:MAG: DUF559 domain-containing protein [Planctomycetota bacterium]